MKLSVIALALAGTTLAGSAFACTYVPGSGYGDDLACANEEKAAPQPAQMPSQAHASMSGRMAESRGMPQAEGRSVNGSAQTSDSQFSEKTNSPMEMQQATDGQM